MRSRGRPTKYHPRYCQELLDYFNIKPTREITVTYTNKKGETWDKTEVIANDWPNKAGFACKIGVDRDTLKEWAKVHPEFSAAIKKAEEYQEHILLTNAMGNRYAQPMAIFALKNIFKWTDRTEQDITSKGKQINGFNYLPPSNGTSNTNNKTGA